MKRRTIYDYPNTLSIQREKSEGNYFNPSSEVIEDKALDFGDYLSSEKVGLLLPLGSNREYNTFKDTLDYALEVGVRGENIAIIYNPDKAEKTIIHSQAREKKCLILNEKELSPLFKFDLIHEKFGVNMLESYGKGSALVKAFAYLKYKSGDNWSKVRDLHILDVDTKNIYQFNPLNYLAYMKVVHENDRRLFSMTAQNNELRDNHYLVIIQEMIRMQGYYGEHYANHLEKLIWRLTGELTIRWDILASRLPFAIGYNVETIWQLFMADIILTEQENGWRIGQVANPNPKVDGGSAGENKHSFVAAMYATISQLVQAQVSMKKHLTKFTSEDYKVLNGYLDRANTMSILPDCNDHGLPFKVIMRPDHIIPPLRLLRQEGCLNVNLFSTRRHSLKNKTSYNKTIPNNRLVNVDG